MTTRRRLDSSRRHRPGVELAMAEIRRFQVLPLYRQGEIRDAANDVDRPRWETGEERVLASAQYIVLATRSDLKGDVEIEVISIPVGKRWPSERCCSTENCSPPARGSRSATHSPTSTISRCRLAGTRSASNADRPPIRLGSPSWSIVDQPGPDLSTREPGQPSSLAIPRLSAVALEESIPLQLGPVAAGDDVSAIPTQSPQLASSYLATPLRAPGPALPGGRGRIQPQALAPTAAELRSSSYLRWWVENHAASSWPRRA
jgi:hypothetical protein